MDLCTGICGPPGLLLYPPSPLGPEGGSSDSGETIPLAREQMQARHSPQADAGTTLTENPQPRCGWGSTISSYSRFKFVP